MGVTAMDFINKYKVIDEVLSDTEHELGNVDERINDLGKQKASVEKSMTEQERQIIKANGGYDALGSNDNKRKERRVELLAVHPGYAQLQRSFDLICSDIGDALVEEKRLTRRFQAAIHRMDAVAALAINMTGNKGVQHDTEAGY